MVYRQATYLCSAFHSGQLPPDTGFEVAFAGRSNAGKSSAINAITAQKALARTSRTPGRTQQVIFFKLTDQQRLVDLPGYGFAKASVTAKQQWQQQAERYLNQRQSLKGIVLLMDIRHPLMESDQHMLQWCQTAKMPVHLVLTKADKLSYGKSKTVLHQVQRQLTRLTEDVSVQLFSATHAIGIDHARKCLDQWLGISYKN